MKNSVAIKKMVITAMLAAVAGVLMSFEFALPMMPPFYKVDFSDVPSVIALFSMGPAAGAAVEIIKIAIKLLTIGTSTMYVGDLANLIGVALFIIPTWLIYKKRGMTLKASREALVVSLPIRIAMSCCVNAFITLPLYASAMGISLNEVVQMVASVNPAIKDLTTFIVLATIPFNFIKLFLNYFIANMLYARLMSHVPQDFKTVGTVNN